MIKGVNRQVVEITQPSCDYFERVVFFVKPEFSAVSQGTLRERANIMESSAGSPPATKVRRKRLAAFLWSMFCLALGVGAGILIAKII
ncbi:MAG: hypothetical protein IJS17_06100 [Clostridia bacterium]|nr:hypothetical protein [Clostridia bacterium]